MGPEETKPFGVRTDPWPTASGRQAQKKLTVPRAEPVTEAVVDAESCGCDRQQKAVDNEPDSGGRIAPVQAGADRM